MIRNFKINLALLCLLTVSQASLAQEPAPSDLFPVDRVIQVDITIDDDDWDELRLIERSFVDALPPSRQYEPVESPYRYLEADVTIDGVRHPRVGIRKKGFIGSQDRNRPSLKIKLNHFDDDGSMQGMSNLTFNNNKQDLSLLSQYLTYKLFDEAGSPGCRSAFAQITVNGKDLGIYTHVESVREPLLEREFGTADGVLYEGTVTDFYPEWEGSFERKRGKRGKGLAQIEKLIEVLDEDDPESLEQLWALVDEEAFYRFWALEGLLSFWDGYSGNRNNYFIYLHPDTGKIHFMPWGTDALFEKNPMGWDKENSPKSVRTQGLIAHRVFATEEGRKRYAAEILELLENHWDEEALLAEITRIETMLDPHLSPSQIYSQDSGRLRRFIEKRRAEVLEEIDDGDMEPWDEPPAEPAIIGPGGFNDRPSESDLLAAAKNGDLEQIERHLRKGADVNEVNREQGTALNMAAMGNQPEAVRLLLERGADPNVRNDDDGTPLIAAAFLGNTEVVEILIEAGADVNARNDDQSTALMAAAAPWRDIKGIVEFISMYFQLDLDLDAVRENRPAAVRILVEAGGEQGGSPRTSKGMEELRAIIKSEENTGLSKAIENCSDLDARDEMGITPLSWAALADNPEAARALLAAGAKIDATNEDGGTALIGAAFLGRTDIVELLLEAGVDTSMRNRDGATAADSASGPFGPEIQGIVIWLRDNLQIRVDLRKMRSQRAECVELIEKADN